MASVQAAGYESENCVIHPSLSHVIVDYKVSKHQQRRKLAAIGGGSERFRNDIFILIRHFSLVG